MKKLAIFLCTLMPFVIFFSKTVLASDLNLYTNPDANSKIISIIKSGAQLIPVFHPTESEWIKVADPTNGNVGWVRLSDLKGPLVFTSIGNGSFSVQQRTISKIDKKTGKPETYRVIEYSGPKQLNPKQVEKLEKQMREHQLQMQKDMLDMQTSMQKMMQHMFQGINFDKDFQAFPIIQPVIVVPEKAVQTQNQAKDKERVKENKY